MLTARFPGLKTMGIAAAKLFAHSAPELGEVEPLVESI